MPEENIPGTLGELLRRARQERGLTIAQIATTTRLPARLLEALERDDLHALPGGMYLRADVVAFADAVHLDRNVALDYLHAATDPPVTPAATPQRPEPLRPRRAGRWMAAAAAVGLVVTALAIWRPYRAEWSGASSRPAVQGQTPIATFSPDARTPVDTPSPSATTGIALSEAVPAAAVTVVPPPVSPAPVADAEVEIVTEPAGARVTIDGVGWGVTPVTIKYLPPGVKRLRITSDGFETEDRVIRVAEDRPRTVVDIALKPIE